MISDIFKKKHKEQMCLTYSFASNEEAYKVMDVLTADDMCETVQFLDIEMDYCVTGYREQDGHKIWSRDMVLFIETIPACPGIEDNPVAEQLAADIKELEELRKIIKDRTGID